MGETKRGVERQQKRGLLFVGNCAQKEDDVCSSEGTPPPRLLYVAQYTFCDLTPVINPTPTVRHEMCATHCNRGKQPLEYKQCTLFQVVSRYSWLTIDFASHSQGLPRSSRTRLTKRTSGFVSHLCPQSYPHRQVFPHIPEALESDGPPVSGSQSVREPNQTMSILT
jgi:hypothetical protein